MLKRKASGGERAWFLEEESEPRNKAIFLAGENGRPDVSACLTGLLITVFRMIVGKERFKYGDRH
jgi:hypothetical protein